MPKRLQRSNTGAPGLKASPSTERDDIAALVASLPNLDLAGLALCWRNHMGGSVPAHIPRWLLVRVLAYRLQVATIGGLDAGTIRAIRGSPANGGEGPQVGFASRSPNTKEGILLRPGALLVREWQGQLHRVMIVEGGFAWNGELHSSLSKVAKAITGFNWNGHRFFGLRTVASPVPNANRPGNGFSAGRDFGARSAQSRVSTGNLALGDRSHSV